MQGLRIAKQFRSKIFRVGVFFGKLFEMGGIFEASLLHFVFSLFRFAFLG